MVSSPEKRRTEAGRRREEEKAISDDRMQAELKRSIRRLLEDIRRAYQIGDFMIVDTKVDKHVGFYAGVREIPTPRLLLAGSIRGYFRPFIGKEMDIIHTVDLYSIQNIKATSAKTNPDIRLEDRKK